MSSKDSKFVRAAVDAIKNIMNSSHLFQTSVGQICFKYSSDSESRERESFYQSWSFYGAVTFKQLNHQWLLQEQIYSPKSWSMQNYGCVKMLIIL